MLKGAIFVCYAISGTTMLLMSAMTTASNLYIAHSTPSITTASNCFALVLVLLFLLLAGTVTSTAAPNPDRLTSHESQHVLQRTRDRLSAWTPNRPGCDASARTYRRPFRSEYRCTSSHYYQNRSLDNMLFGVYLLLAGAGIATLGRLVPLPILINSRDTTCCAANAGPPLSPDAVIAAMVPAVPHGSSSLTAAAMNGGFWTPPVGSTSMYVRGSTMSTRDSSRHNNRDASNHQQLFDPRAHDPVSFSSAQVRKLPPKSSGDYASAPSVSSYVVSSNFTLSSGTTDGSSVRSPIFDHKPRDESKTNAFSNQLKKLYREFSHLETKLLVDSGEPQDKSRIIEDSDRGSQTSFRNDAESSGKFPASGVWTSLRNIPDKYNIIIRPWTNCFYCHLKNPRRSSLTSKIALEYLQEFIYYTYTFYAEELKHTILILATATAAIAHAPHPAISNDPQAP
ncbi:hypothetical protein DFH94DRAFT_812796 [Russula ochroleuca]|uniref:Uncharacterized protein n=1 Tax=Russula ochroleuca TaxID=152965 RepID=A0A9P5JX39_9AGAM|nr:hypothetical protein DFH94DRAFT_812796 [Russula ochroleuca]